MHTKFMFKSLNGRDPLEDRHRWEDSIKMYLREYVKVVVSCSKKSFKMVLKN